MIDYCDNGHKRVKGNSTLWAYNELARAQYLKLNYDGYIIGIEKHRRKHIGLKKGQLDEKRFSKLSETTGFIQKQHRVQNELFLKHRHDNKAMLVTHIIGFFDGTENLCNIYENHKEFKANYSNAYEIGFGSFLNGAFRQDLTQKIKAAQQAGDPYTHLFVMSMGWSNDQHESIWRYNRIIESVETTARNDKDFDGEFKPLVIGLTWPSVWLSKLGELGRKIGHFSSLMNKANDADEIGYTVGNMLINFTIPSVLSEVDPDREMAVIAVGHSFGARVISRAIFSRNHLAEAYRRNEPVVDLFIGLQSAFSLNRFLDKGTEGAPYLLHGEMPMAFVMTTSQHDGANGFANLFNVPFAGGVSAKTYSDNYPEKIVSCQWQKGAEQKLPELGADNNILIVNASSIINDYQNGGNCDRLSGHNDVLDDDIGRLLWLSILAYVNK